MNIFKSLAEWLESEEKPLYSERDWNRLVRHINAQGIRIINMK